MGVKEWAGEQRVLWVQKLLPQQSVGLILGETITVRGPPMASIRLPHPALELEEPMCASEEVGEPWVMGGFSDFPCLGWALQLPAAPRGAQSRFREPTATVTRGLPSHRLCPRACSGQVRPSGEYTDGQGRRWKFRVSQSGAWKSKIKASAGPVSPEASLLDVQTAVPSPCPHGIVSVCVSLCPSLLTGTPVVVG